MKRKMQLGIAAAIIALAAGVTIRTVASQVDNSFKMNLEAIAEGESSLICIHQQASGGHIKTCLICIGNEPYWCEMHSAYVGTLESPCVSVK